MDEMVAPHPLVFNFRICGWLGIDNQGVLPPPLPSPWSEAYSGWQAISCCTEPRSSGFQGGVGSANCFWQGGVPTVGSTGMFPSEWLPSLDGPTHQV